MIDPIDCCFDAMISGIDIEMLSAKLQRDMNAGHLIPSLTASHTQLLPLTGTRPEGTLPQHCQFITNISHRADKASTQLCCGTVHGQSCWQLIFLGCSAPGTGTDRGLERLVVCSLC